MCVYGKRQHQQQQQRRRRRQQIFSHSSRADSESLPTFLARDWLNVCGWVWLCLCAYYFLQLCIQVAICIERSSLFFQIVHSTETLARAFTLYDQPCMCECIQHKHTQRETNAYMRSHTYVRAHTHSSWLKANQTAATFRIYEHYEQFAVECDSWVRRRLLIGKRL